MVSGMSRVTLAVLVDALRYDFVTPEDAPFLAGLERRGVGAALRQSFGFLLWPAIFAGLWPEQSGVAYMFCFDPDHSPFAGLPLDALSREEINEEVRRVEAWRGHRASARYGHAAEIPIPLLPYFSFGQPRHIEEPGALGPHPTLFDALRAAGKRWLWLGHPLHDGTTQKLLQDFYAGVRDDHALVYLHFSEQDWAGHTYGPDSPERRQVLREIDAALEAIYTRLHQLFPEVNGCIFGDHGMVAVERTVNAEAALHELPLQVGRDYLYFLDSTQARVWILHERARSLLVQTLTALPGGRLLGDADFALMRFRMPDRRYGDLIWQADPGVMISPNFFQRSGMLRGLHGYGPDARDNWARLIVFGPDAPRSLPDLVEMVELYPLLLRLTGLTPGSSPAAQKRGVGDTALSSSPTAWEGKVEDAPLPSSSAAQETRVEAVALSPSPAAWERGPGDEGLPFISVVIPTHNRAGLLERTLRAFDAQDYPRRRYELIVVDDGSADETPELARRLAGELGCRLTVLRQERAGPAAARNHGIRAAQGEIVLLTGDDCIPPPQLLMEHARLYTACSDERIAVLGHITWHPELKLTPLLDVLARGAQFAFGAIHDKNHVPFTHFYSSNVSVRRSDLLEVGLFDESFRDAAFEDTELGYRLERAGVRLVYNPSAVTYHYHPTDLQRFLERQRAAGRAAVKLYQKHPELRDVVGITEVANLRRREEFYTAVLRYAFILGVEEGLLGEAEERLGLEHLRSRFEEWVNDWAAQALRQVSEAERRAADLANEVLQRDQYIRRIVQEKDARINELESTLQRYHRLLPFRLYFALKGIVTRVRGR